MGGYEKFRAPLRGESPGGGARSDGALMTFQPGKDRETEATIEIFTRELTRLGLDLEFVARRHPGENLYSCELADRNNPRTIHTNGKGATAEAAAASALGEMAERLLNQSFFDGFFMFGASDAENFRRFPGEIWAKYPEDLIDGENRLDLGRMGLSGSDRERTARFFRENSLFSPELVREIGWTCLRPLTDYPTSDTAKGICAVPLRNELNPAETRYFPLRYLESCFCTNGMCAGNTPAEAKVQGLSEIFERVVRRFLYGSVPESFGAGLSRVRSRALPEIPPELIARRWPDVAATIAGIARRGLRITCHDGSLGGLFPVAVVCLRPACGLRYRISAGAHPHMGLALGRALTELVQGADWDDVGWEEMSFEDLAADAAPEAPADGPDGERALGDALNFIASFTHGSAKIHPGFFTDESNFQFADWSFESGSTAEQYARLLGICRKLGKTVWCHDASFGELCAYRLIVPNFSEIYLFDGPENEDELTDPSLSRKMAALSLSDPRLPEGAWTESCLSLAGLLRLAEPGSWYDGLSFGAVRSLADLYRLMRGDPDEPGGEECAEILARAADVAGQLLAPAGPGGNSPLYAVCLAAHARFLLEDETGLPPEKAAEIIGVFCDNEYSRLADGILSDPDPAGLMKLIRAEPERNPVQAGLIKIFKKLIKSQAKVRRNNP